MRVAALVPDLMDRSRVSAAAAAVGAPVAFLRAPSELADDVAGPPDVVLVDLDRLGDPAALAELVRAGAPVVAYGSHVDAARLDAARAAGAAEVLPRSAFFRRLPQLLGAAGTQRSTGG